MALFSRARGILKQTLTNNINKDYAASTPSIYQMIRCMSSKLFFGGISFNTDETSLREECSKYGEVIEARIIVDRDTGNSRGFGFVTFASAEDASSAIQALDQKELHGRTIRVNYATDRTRGYTGVGGGGGYGGGDGGYGGGGGGGGGYGGGNYGSGSGGYGGGNYGGGGGGYGGRNYEGNAGSYGGGNYGGNEGGYGGGGGGGGAYASNGGYTSGGVGGGGESNFGGGVQYPSGNNFVSGNQNFGVPNGVNYMPEGNNDAGAGAGAGVQILNGIEYGVADVPPYNSQQGNLEDDNDHHQVYADKRA